MIRARNLRARARVGVAIEPEQHGCVLGDRHEQLAEVSERHLAEGFSICPRTPAGSSEGFDAMYRVASVVPMMPASFEYPVAKWLCQKSSSSPGAAGRYAPA